NRVTKVKYGGGCETSIVDDFEGTFNWQSNPQGRCRKTSDYSHSGSYCMDVDFYQEDPTKAFKVVSYDWSNYDSLTLWYKFNDDTLPGSLSRFVNVYVKDGSGGGVNTLITKQIDMKWHRLALNLNAGNLDKSDIDSIIVNFSRGIYDKGEMLKVGSTDNKSIWPGGIDDIQVKSAKFTKVTYKYDSYDANVNLPTDLNFPKNHLTKMTDESGWTMYFYDKRGRLGEKWVNFTDITCDTFKVHYNYNKVDQITSITYPGDVTVGYQYDKFGRSKNVSALSTNLATITHDANSRDSIIDYGVGVKSKFQYYPTDWIKSINATHPMLGALINNSYEYDSTGNRKSEKESGSLAASYNYDDLNRLTNETHTYGGWNINYNYDAVGNRTGYTYYPGTDRLKTKGGITYYYDENGNITGTSFGTSIEYNYRDLPLKISTAWGETYTFAYNGDGLRVKKHVGMSDRGYGEHGYEEQYKDHTYKHPNGDKHDDARDMGDITIDLSNNWLKIDLYFDYIYENQGELENLYISIDTDQTVNSGNIHYPDSLYTKVIPLAAWEYCIYVKDLNDFGIFDRYGNKFENPDGMTVNYTGGGPNQRVKIKIPAKLIGNPEKYQITMLTTMPGFTNGTDSRATDVVSGDSLGLQNNTIIGALGQPPPTSENYYFIHDEGGNVLCDIDREGSIKSRYIYINGKHIAKIDGSSKYYYHLDPLGSPLVITKDWIIPSIAKEYKYKAFGEMKYESGTYDNTHKFTGKEEDGSGLYYFGARYYDKSLGRWISPDPASYPSDLRLNDPQSFNPYVYCRNNPIKYIDPDGRRIFWKGTTIVPTEAEKYEESLEILILSIEQEGLTLPFYYKRGFWDFSRKGQQSGGLAPQYFGPKTKSTSGLEYSLLSVNFGACRIPIQGTILIDNISGKTEEGEDILRLEAGYGDQLWTIQLTGTKEKLNEILREEGYEITYDERYDDYNLEKIERETE
ncbi:RHS repeat-associated core domain-containing protein, partial [candidate division WOR-3 bacterium]|nr:RHS repeat-associated core domain-containing protein [candidate division WOR-3 bacterium]